MTASTLSGLDRPTSAGDRVQRLAALLYGLRGTDGSPPSLLRLRAFLQEHAVDPTEVEALLRWSPVSRPRATPSAPASPHVPDQVRPSRIPATRDAGPQTVPASPSEANEEWVQEEWVDDLDPFAVPYTARQATAEGLDLSPAACAALTDLLADAHRTGTVSVEQVTSLGVRRGLTMAQITEVRDGLEGHGIELVEATTPLERYDGAGDYDGGRARRGEGSEQRDQLGAYFTRVGRYRLLDAEAEVRLGTLVQAGLQAEATLAVDDAGVAAVHRDSLRDVVRRGRQAHHDLVTANLRLAVSIAKRYVYSGVPLADLVQDGNLGVMRAADKFDPTMGYKFSTYATWWIKQHVTRSIADTGRVIRLPVHLHEQVQKVCRAQGRLAVALDREPSLAEVAAELGDEPGHVAALLDYSQPVASLDRLVGDDATLGSLLGPDDVAFSTTTLYATDPAAAATQVMLTQDLDRFLDVTLTDREQEVVRRRNGFGRYDAPDTLDAIGQDLGLTRERIRQVEKAAYGKLRDASSKAGGLLHYLLDDVQAELPVLPQTGPQLPLPTPQARVPMHDEPGGASELVDDVAARTRCT